MAFDPEGSPLDRAHQWIIRASRLLKKSVSCFESLSTNGNSLTIFNALSGFGPNAQADPR
jgi:hypothetical protein